MKSKLSVALAAAGCVLAASPANAVTVASHRGAITSSVPGAVLFDDFYRKNQIIRTDEQVLVIFG